MPPNSLSLTAMPAPLHDLKKATVHIDVASPSHPSNLPPSSGNLFGNSKEMLYQTPLLTTLEKNGCKRQRIVTVNSLSASTLQPTQHTVQPEAIPLTIDKFLRTTQECTESKALQNKVLSYVFQKHVLQHHHPTDLVPTNATLSEIRVFLNDNSDNNQPTSTVYYMELVDENSDCPETMTLVAEDLLTRFNTVQDGWVIMVGHRKTYKHLMSTVQYSNE